MSAPAYRVIWKPQILEVQVADIVASRMEAGIPVEPVSQAMNAIDRLLERDPLNAGESRGDNKRIHFVGPLRIIFKVNEAKRIVSIKDVIDIQHKPR